MPLVERWAAQGAHWYRILLPLQETQEMQETLIRSLGQEDPLEEEMATCSSILGWKIPETEGPGGLQSTGLQSRTWLNDWTHTAERQPIQCQDCRLRVQILTLPLPSCPTLGTYLISPQQEDDSSASSVKQDNSRSCLIEMCSQVRCNRFIDWYGPLLKFFFYWICYHTVFVLCFGFLTMSHVVS